MRKKRVIWLLVVVVATLVMAGCRSQDRFGQRKAPKNCNSCTRWNK